MLAGFKERLRDQMTPAVALAKLHGMAAMLNYRPALRHHLKDTHPRGKSITFQSRIEFLTRDERVAVHAIFDRGKMKVGRGRIDNPDSTIRVRDRQQLRRFLTPGTDILSMVLDKDVILDGNITHLAKFAHLSRVVAKGNRKVPVPPERRWDRKPSRWQDLKASPAGRPCPDSPAGEATFIEDPHLAAYDLDDFPVIKRQLWVHRTVQPEICSERPRLITEFMVQQEANGQSPVLRQARAYHHLMTNRRAIIHDDDLLAGTTTARRIGVMLFPESGGCWIWPELLTMEARELNPYRISDEDIQILNRQVFPFWTESNIREWAYVNNGRPKVLDYDQRYSLYFMWKAQTISHTVADVPRALGRGLLDIQREAREKEAQADDDHRDFYRALQVAIDGVLDYSRRLSGRAAELAKETEDAGQKQTYQELARICEKVPARPADTLAEAVQAVWLLFMAQHQESMNAGLSVGRMDMWLQPYLEKEMQGITDPAEKTRRIEKAIELACAFMLKLTDHLPLVPDLGNRLFGGSSSDQVITLGGQTPDGKSAVCDMTWIFLKATEMLRLRDPNMNARYAPGVNSEAYLRRLCEVNLLTGATPSLHNDDAVVPALVNQGFEIEHARDWSATGCVEPTSCGRHYGHTNCMMFNMVAPLEMALHDGFHPVVEEQIGPKSGDPRSFASYEQFLEAYKLQLAWLIDRSVECNNILGRAHQELKPTPFLSSLFTGPMESGRDLVEGGAVYNTSGTAMIGLSDVVDSLCAVYTLVFDQGRISLDGMLKAVDADFVGHESLLSLILNRSPKFGQDHDLPREMAKDLMDFVYERFQSHHNYRGGLYLPGYWSMSNHVAFGMLSGALPSGRRRGKAFTPGLTPSHLSDAALTEQIRTVAGLDKLKIPNNIAFNVKVVPGADDSHQDIVDRMTAYVAAYFEMGGMQMQFNVMSTRTLRDAIDKPDEYRDLLVRISGYNAYFVELNRDIQQEIIERMEHSLGR